MTFRPLCSDLAVCSIMGTEPHDTGMNADPPIYSSTTHTTQCGPREFPDTPERTMKPEVTYDDFSKLDLRVATVLGAREHPNANKLLLIEIKVGDEEKQIVAGIRGHYEPAALVGTQIIVVNNLEEAVIRGEESRGMLLAVGDGERIVLVRPERECAPGAAVR